MIQECKKCINTSQNPWIKFNKQGYCNICQTFKKKFSKQSLVKELKLFRSFIGRGEGDYDVMVGLSGGKDSSATLYQIKEMGFTPLAFTLDTGYLHRYIFQRARNVAKKICRVDYKIIPIKKYVRRPDVKLFRQMAELYSRNKKEEFIKDYKTGRKNYRGVVRPCWVCRKIFIRAYYSEALKHGVRVIVLGINEWTSLEQTTRGENYVISAIRKLKPFSNKPPVYIVHFPFLVQTKLKDTKKVLKKMGWNYYRSVQSNAASCLLALAAEKPLYDNLGFHPDTTRLAREVTVGFLSKRQAKKALKKTRKYKYSVPQILKRAGVVDS